MYWNSEWNVPHRTDMNLKIPVIDRAVKKKTYAYKFSWKNLSKGLITSSNMNPHFTHHIVRIYSWFNILLCDGIAVFGTVIHSTLVQRGNMVHHSKIIIVMRNRWFWFVTWKIEMNNFNNRTQLAPTFITGIGWKRVEIIKCKQKIMFNWTPKFTNKLLDIEKNPLCFHMGMRGL